MTGQLRPCLVVEGRPSPDLLALCHGLGVAISARAENPPPDQLVQVLALATPDRAVEGLSAPFHGFLQIDDRGSVGSLASLHADLADGGVVIAITTGSVWASPSFCPAVAEALDARLGLGNALDLRICLGEAFANAIIHGNLGISGGQYWRLRREGAAGEAIAARLGDEVIARRRLRVVATARDGGADITVSDEGDGFQPDDMDRPPAGSSKRDGGRGLRLMARLAATVRHDAGGRRVRFSMNSPATST